MTIGDVLGWLGVITLFTLFGVTIRFIWLRAHPPMASDERWLSYILNRIAKLDARIKRLLAERDDLKRQAREHQKLRQELEEKGVIEQRPELPLLVAAIGSDAVLNLDLASLRAVRTQTSMEFTRIQDATLAKLKNVLDRERSLDRRVNVHLAVHSGPGGMLLGGVAVDAAALSEILDGVHVLLIAGCESSSLGDFLGVVPYVISMNEAVANNDAAFFARAFWTQIGKRKKPAEALQEALKRSPSGMSEYVERHF